MTAPVVTLIDCGSGDPASAAKARERAGSAARSAPVRLVGPLPDGSKHAQGAAAAIFAPGGPASRDESVR